MPNYASDGPNPSRLRERSLLDADHSVHVKFKDVYGDGHDEKMGKFDKINLIDMADWYTQLLGMQADRKVFDLSIYVVKESDSFSYSALLKEIDDSMPSVVERYERAKGVVDALGAYAVLDDPMERMREDNRDKVMNFGARKKFLEDLRAKVAEAAGV